jgi:uncharacterized membrane-anchored protein YhcB (DUF1043 family)
MVKEPDGLGLAWFIPIIVAIAGSVGGAVATRLISGPSSPSQRQIEEQMRLQQRLEIERMLEQEQVQQRQTEQIVSYAPLALGAVALVMLLR